jgi:hypothetical protein
MSKESKTLPKFKLSVNSAFKRKNCSIENQISNAQSLHDDIKVKRIKITLHPPTNDQLADSINMNRLSLEDKIDASTCKSSSFGDDQDPEVVNFLDVNDNLTPSSIDCKMTQNIASSPFLFYRHCHIDEDRGTAEPTPHCDSI